MVIVQLNARLQPMDRGEFFEDPLDALLKSAGLGEVSGGGSTLAPSGEIESCDVELSMPDIGEQAIAKLMSALETVGTPKGSKVQFVSTDTHRECGWMEGMAVYLNGTDLPDSTYASCDSNFVYSEFNRLLEGQGRVLSHWQGPAETALYMYGSSFDEMKQRIATFISTYPLCERCRVTQIA